MFARNRTIRSKTQTRPSSTTTTKSNQSSPSHSLSIVSWNISSAQPSQAAPNQISRLGNAPRLIRDEVLSKSPDIIALQETASSSWGGEIFKEYVSIGTRLALHTREYIDLLIKRNAFSDYVPISLPDLPAVAALLTYHGTKLAIASVHLPHTKEAAPLRKKLCQSIIQSITTHDVDNIILIGDFNMRKDEDRSIENLEGGEWQDAWKKVTNSDKSTMFTWNGRENMYHGPDNFKFTARFDRCYVRGAKLGLREFDLVGNRTVEGKGDYLSDHYGLFVQCGVTVSEGSGVAMSRESSLDRQGDTSISRQSSSTESSSNVERDPNSNRPHNAEELRRLRLQRFESSSSATGNISGERLVSNSSTTTKRDDERDAQENNTVIDLTEDSDDENRLQNKRNGSHAEKGSTSKKARY